eukprot:3616068-Rhodomonas_salina.1
MRVLAAALEESSSRRSSSFSCEQNGAQSQTPSPSPGSHAVELTAQAHRVHERREGGEGWRDGGQRGSERGSEQESGGLSTNAEGEGKGLKHGEQPGWL